MEKRLTTARQWCEAKNDLENEFGYSHIWCRLNAIENILGEEYDLEQLRQLVKTTQTGRCKRCRYSRQPSRQTQLYGEPGTLTCHHGPCNRRNVNENDFCSYFAQRRKARHDQSNARTLRGDRADPVFSGGRRWRVGRTRSWRCSTPSPTGGSGARARRPG